MWYPSIIWRIGLEPYGEYIVLIVASHMEILCSSSVMAQLQRCQLQLRYMLRPVQSEAVKMFPDFGIIAEVGNGGVSPPTGMP